ncbi:hypothetical protein [Polynucleobacter paneuropaeus]|uniref:hypothetical protein n=1 Tax=Polynucleobacter paneuropaeus TaxID=2527775 RepID=UPI001BFDA34D|nr:hypothetical protein [Polynucleobacter paneuropaeus]MBT8621505.1 hypothetical protein [Polynucleobacter paneuropaeus]
MALSKEQKIAIGVAIAAVVLMGYFGSRAGQSLSEKQQVNQKPQSSSLVVSPSNLNTLEKTMTLGVSKEADWNKFVDTGGLNRNNNLYGISITSINASWTENGDLKSAMMKASSTVSPEDVRKALTRACGVTMNDWVFESSPIPSGKANSQNITCLYKVFPYAVEIGIGKLN